MVNYLIFFLTLEFFLYFSWVYFLRNEGLDDKRKKKYPSYISFILTNAMLLIALMIVWQIFKLNLDFGLVLGIATIIAVFSWVLGSVTKILVLKQESKSYFFILIFIFCLRSFAYEPYQIPSTSMFPGLQVGDFVLVNKYAYGLRFPTAKKTFLKVGEPSRGEVAVFMPPHTICNVSAIESRPDLSLLALDESQVFINRFNILQKNRCTKLGIKYIKRIIGVPFDKIELKGYSLFINGVEVPQEVLGVNGVESLVRETINKQIFVTKRIGESLNQKFKWVIPEGHYLALGDNRDNSLDSRAWGYFSEKRLVGRADYIWLHWPEVFTLPSFNRNRSIH